jgi:outer membrane lipoprotein SlyB
MANSTSEKHAAKTEKPLKPNHTHGEIAGAIAGEVVGGIVGSLAGPPGAVAGMVVGAAVGALAGEVLDQEAERSHIHDEDLDDEIGVTSGDLGAAKSRLPK